MARTKHGPVTGTKGTEVVQFFPLTQERWADFEQLFGQRGACGGCWCMWWRLKRSVFDQQKGEGNHQAMKQLVHSGEVPGILAYHKDQPVGWCSVAARDRFPVLDRSRVLKRVDDQPVWSVVCFYIHKDYRHIGMSVQLLRAAIEYVKQQGGCVVEGYPIIPRSKQMPEAFAWVGLAAAFSKAGFQECARRSESRPIMRFYL